LIYWNAVTWGADPAQEIVVWAAEAGTPAHDSLRLLASWAADPGHAISGSGLSYGTRTIFPLV
jgi:hypothetical protein